MTIQQYIATGIAETYTLGLATEEERRQFEQLLPFYPELLRAQLQFERRLEEYASSTAVKPPEDVKFRVLERVTNVFQTTEWLQNLAKNPDRINDLTSRQFEELAAILLRRQGYEVTLTPATRDGGKDLVVAHHTGFGQLLYFVECKKCGPTRKIGVEVLRELYGTIAHDNITAGILVTNSYFTADALQWQMSVCYRLKLVDRTLLLQWLGEFRKGGAGRKFFGFF